MIIDVIVPGADSSNGSWETRGGSWETRDGSWEIRGWELEDKVIGAGRQVGGRRGMGEKIV